MAQDMIDGAELVVEDGETTLVIYAKAIKKWGITGHAETLNYFDGDIKYAANIVEKEDGNPTAFSFKLPSKGLTSNKFKVTMTTDVNVLGVSMGKELSADMQIDFSKIK